jgi:hypothetical protein
MYFRAADRSSRDAAPDISINFYCDCEWIIGSQ